MTHYNTCYVVINIPVVTNLRIWIIIDEPYFSATNFFWLHCYYQSTISEIFISMFIKKCIHYKSKKGFNKQQVFNVLSTQNTQSTAVAHTP